MKNNNKKYKIKFLTTIVFTNSKTLKEDYCSYYCWGVNKIDAIQRICRYFRLTNNNRIKKVYVRKLLFGTIIDKLFNRTRKIVKV